MAPCCPQDQICNSPPVFRSLCKWPLLSLPAPPSPHLTHFNLLGLSRPLTLEWFGSPGPLPFSTQMPCLLESVPGCEVSFPRSHSFFVHLFTQHLLLARPPRGVGAQPQRGLEDRRAAEGPVLTSWVLGGGTRWKTRGRKCKQRIQTSVSTAEPDLGDGVEGVGSGGGEDLAQASGQESQEAIGLWFSPHRGNPR